MSIMKGYVPARTDDAAELAAKMEGAYEGCYGHALDDERKPASEKPVEKPAVEEKDTRPREQQRVSLLLQEETDRALERAGGLGMAMIAAATSVTKGLLRDFPASEKLDAVLEKIQRFVAEAYTHRPGTSEAEAKEEARRWMSRMLGQPEKRVPYEPPKLTPEEVRAELKGSRNIVSEARKVLAHLKRKGERYSGAERIALEDEVRVSLTTHFAAEGMSLTEAQRQTANIVSSAMSERPRQFRRSDPPRDHAVTIIPKESEAPPAMEEKMAADAGETPKAERTPEQIAAHHAEIAAKLAAKEQRRMAQEALDAAKRGSKERRAEAMEATREKRAAEKAKAEAATAAKRAKSEAKRAKSEKRAGRGGAQASA